MKKFLSIMLVVNFLLMHVYGTVNAYAKLENSSITYTLERIRVEYEQYGIVKAFSGGKCIWTYTTDMSPLTELETISDVYSHNDTAYIVINGALHALNALDGKEKWKINEVGASNSCVFDANGNIYISGFYGPNFKVISETGDILYEENNEDYYWVYDLKIKENTLYIYYDSGMGGVKTFDISRFNIPQEIKVVLNGEEIEFDQPPVMINDRVMVPIRAIFESLGYNLEWEESNQTATAVNEYNELAVQEGLCGVHLDSEWVSFDVANTNISGRILVPVRVVSECAGAEVEWDGANQTVIINYDSHTANKRISLLKYRLAIDNYMPNIFSYDEYSYLKFSKNMYGENALQGAFVDWMAENVIDEGLDKEKYIDVLSTLLTMSDFTISDNIENLYEHDSLKTFGEYAWNVSEILIGTLEPEGSKKLEIIKSLIDADSEAINITIDTIEKYERLNKIQLETEFKLNILNLIETGTNDEKLIEACQDMKLAEKKRVLLELEIFSDNMSSISEYLGYDVLYKQMAYPLMKQSDIYANDATLRTIVDKGEELYKNADKCLGALETGFKLGLFAGDMLFGTSNTTNRVSEIKALTEIRNSLVTSNNVFYAQPLVYADDINVAYQYISDLIPQIKFINNIHLRGEYCMYKLLIEDMQLFSVIYLLDGDNIENLDTWWENTKSNLTWYDKKLSSIYQ